jgi:hypothetical protein
MMARRPQSAMASRSMFASAKGWIELTAPVAETFATA